MPGGPITIREATTPADRKAFIELIYRLYANDPAWVPPLRGEALELIDGIKKNPWFEHGRAKYWLAMQDGQIVGRISAQVDTLVLGHMGPGIGHWGMFEMRQRPGGRRPAARHRRGLAARRGHDDGDGAVQPVDLGRARPARQRLRAPADGDDGRTTSTITPA